MKSEKLAVMNAEKETVCKILRVDVCVHGRDMWHAINWLKKGSREKSREIE